MDPNGYIVAAGTTLGSIGRDLVQVRCEPDGDLDETFGVGGKMLYDYGNVGESVNGMALQTVQRLGDLSDYKIILTGDLGDAAGTFVTARYHTRSGPIWRAIVNDFNGDRASELAAFRPGTGEWLLGDLAGPWAPEPRVTTIYWGVAGDKLVPGDYDGDGKYDVAAFRSGIWHILLSGSGTYRAIFFGLSGDTPIPGDFDGDSRTDVAVFRPANGDWYVLRSSDQTFRGVHWGATGDKPVVGDYDGDDRADLTVFRSGIWYILQSGNGQLRIAYFGLSNDIPVVYDIFYGLKTPLGVFRNGSWYFSYNNGQSYYTLGFGVAGDVPFVGVYGSESNLGVFRNGTFLIDRENRTWTPSGGTVLPVPTYYAQ